MNKRALTPTISSILLICLIIAIAIIIVIWMMGFFSEGILKFSAPIENTCKEIKFKVVITSTEAVSFPELQISNTGSTPIFDFSIKYVKENGESENVFLGKTLDIGNSLKTEIVRGTINTKEIDISPVLLGISGSKNKQYICLDNTQKISLSQVDIS
jgi:hypothetical protein